MYYVLVPYKPSGLVRAVVLSEIYDNLEEAQKVARKWLEDGLGMHLVYALQRKLY